MKHSIATKGSRKRNYNAHNTYNKYRKLTKSVENDWNNQDKILENIGMIKTDAYSQELADDVIKCFCFENVNHNKLSRISESLISHKYQLAGGNSPIQLADVAGDRLLIEALNKVFFANLATEEFIIAIRRILLTEFMSKGSIDSSLISLATGMAIYSANNEYVYFIDDQEQEMLNVLVNLIKTLTSQHNWQPNNVAGSIIVYAMYNPLSQLSSANELVKYGLDSWPQFSRKVLNKCLVDIFDEIERSKQIPSLGAIEDKVSKDVQAQYESNPYPCWSTISFQAPMNYGDLLQRNLNGFKAPEFIFNNHINILIAGSGTGKHVLLVAKCFRNASILAIDISRRSLSYAQKMAEKYNVHNVKFLHADILNLGKLNQKFHVIESCGVLHHMQNPIDGLRVLCNLLEPQGLIKLGLYSETARRCVVMFREVIKNNNLQATPKDIRAFRKAIIGQKGKLFDLIRSYKDFYNMSGLRDLLFNCMEHRYTPNQIADICDELNLQFLGFFIKPEILKAYKRQYPEDINCTNLNNWQQFEQEHTVIFGNMYNFYCQKQ